jgi:transposase-like protein
MIRLWRNAWEEFVPFLDYDLEIRCMIYSTNAIESPQRSLPAGYPRTRALPSRASRDEVPVPCNPQPGPDWNGPRRWMMRWKPAINAFAITFGDRWPAAETY